ncbi:nitrite reductase small subunit NirD [Arthrobacter halodurans]|uniref:Nitrite reductase small subunit NirD n=1 Tax=Arthrobacter halodurans TaxID=516699 RepID=A0ABV4UJU3_9MICC
MSAVVEDTAVQDAEAGSGAAGDAAPGNTATGLAAEAGVDAGVAAEAGGPGGPARRPRPLTWHNVCDVTDLEAGWGEAAWIGSGQIALFRLADGSVHATDQRCPATGAHVMARGIVGGRSTDAGTVATVASPLHKQVYRLDSGECLNAPELRLAVHPVRIEDGHVWVGVSL